MKTERTVLEQGQSRIIVFDDLDPEAAAMVLALYSRDPKSALVHLDDVAQRGTERFMKGYYVGYGHKSIGDCGSTTICAEGISTLAAKAIQDWALYNGQEASTRYINMATQPLIDPINTPESKAILDTWMGFYHSVVAALIPHLKDLHPRSEEEKESVWENAIKARSFDIARGFLPAGVSTYVGWHTNLRQAADHLHWLEHHPLAEVRAITAMMYQAVQERYPNSFGHKKYDQQEAWYRRVATEKTYFDDPTITTFEYQSFLRSTILNRYLKVLEERPEKTDLPPVMRNAGEMVFRFLLDFGSFRDIQRQRSMICPMPLLSTYHGFHPWYIEQLPRELQQDARDLLTKQERRITTLEVPPETRQYYTALGYRVPCEVTVNLAAAIYIAELRAGEKVHSTLRIIAQQMGRALQRELPTLALYCDNSPDAFSFKRGKDTIVQRVT